MKTGDWRKLVDDIKVQLFDSLKERDILEDKLAVCEKERDEEKEWHAFYLEQFQSAEARAEKAEAERNEARATKDMHKARQEDEIELRLKAEAERDTEHEAAISWHRCWDKACDDIGKLKAESADLTLRLEQMRRAIEWALGERGEFSDRQPGQGAFWWRTELRKRSSLSAPPGELVREVRQVLKYYVKTSPVNGHLAARLLARLGGEA
jgi:hypothetical protein